MIISSNDVVEIHGVGLSSDEIMALFFEYLHLGSPYYTKSSTDAAIDSFFMAAPESVIDAIVGGLERYGER